MTNVQVQYWANQEQKRHNIAVEGETYRHNIVTENQNQQSLTEIARHNQATELLGQQTLSETTRHNKAVEGISRDTLNETIRHNYANEAIGRTQASASMIQAQAAKQNAKTNAERVASENQLRAAQLQYQKLTNDQLEWENYLRLDPNNQEVEYFFSSIGSALTGLQGHTGAAGGLIGSLAKIIL